MKKTLLLLAVFLWTGLQVAMAQAIQVKGTVLDEKQNPIPAASITIKGTSAGTMTSIDGTFELTIPNGQPHEIKISALGFAPKLVTVKDGQDVTINMTVAKGALDDVMIIGYGETTKEKYTGAADKIDAKRIERFPVSDVTKAIEGAAPGIQVTNGGGQPGTGASVRIRGMGSLSASSAPLYVVDGSPYVGDITSINPLDIESITVLKDATATSLYGARGANGVIMITTKRGKMGADSKPQMNFSAKVGIVKRGLPNYDVLKSEKDYYEIAWEAYRNELFKSYGDMTTAGEIASGLQPSQDDGLVKALGGYNSYDVADDQLIDPITGKLNPNAKLKYHDNWDDELSRIGLRHDYNLSVSGASDKSDYYFSFGYLKEEGYVKYSDYDRFTGRMNVNSKINDWLTTGLNVSGALSTQDNGGADGSTSGGYNPFFASRTNAPIYPVYYYDSLNQKEIDPLTGENKFDWGAKNLYPGSSIGTRNTLPNANVLGSLSLDQDRLKMINFVAVPYVEAKFAKYFTFHTDINLNLYTSNSTDYNNPFYGQFAGQGGLSAKGNTSLMVYTWKQYLSYTRTFNGVHNLDVLVDHENYSLRINGVSASRAGLPFPGPELAGAATALSSSSSEDNHRIESYLGRVNYDYKSKYMFTASLRKDGSSRFSPATRWGDPFWAVGASWNMGAEDFIKNIKSLDLLKAKISYGTQGNENLGSNYYAWRALYSVEFPNGDNAGAVPNTLGNDQLTWEKSQQLNAGVEVSAFKKRVSAEFNYFVRTSKDLLFNVPLAPSVGITSIPMNAATVQNKGFEITLNADVLKAKDFVWNTNMNFTHYKSAITKMAPGQDSLLNGNYLWKAGHSIYDFYLLESHVDQANGKEKYYYIDSTGARMDTTSVSYAIANGGKDYRGSALPKLSGAMNNSFTYKNFDLQVLFTFSIGGKYYDQIYQTLMGSNELGNNYHSDILNRWTPDNTTSDIPKLDIGNSDVASSSTRFLIDGSYFNLRNVSLGYSFNNNVIKKAGLTSLRIFATADNLLLLSKRKGMDPQSTFGGNPSYIYSPAQTFMFGVNIGL